MATLYAINAGNTDVATNWIEALQTTVVSIASATNTVVLDGDVTSTYYPGASGTQFTLTGTTGNIDDGMYTVVSVTFNSPNTEIVTVETPPADDTGAGWSAIHRIPTSSDEIDLQGRAMNQVSMPQVAGMVDAIAGGSLTLNGDFTSTGQVGDACIIVGIGASVTITANITYGLGSGYAIYAPTGTLVDYIGTLDVTGGGTGIYLYNGVTGNNIGSSAIINNQSTGIGIAVASSGTEATIGATVNNSSTGIGISVSDSGTIATLSGSVSNTSTGISVQIVSGNITTITNAGTWGNGAGGEGVMLVTSGSIGQIDNYTVDFNIYGNSITTSNAWTVHNITDTQGGGSITLNTLGANLIAVGNITNVPIIVTAEVSISATVYYSLASGYAIDIQTGGSLSTSLFLNIYNYDAGVGIYYNNGSTNLFEGAVNNLGSGYGIYIAYGSTLTLQGSVYNREPNYIGQGYAGTGTGIFNDGTIEDIGGSVENYNAYYGIVNNGNINNISTGYIIFQDIAYLYTGAGIFNSGSIGNIGSGASFSGKSVKFDTDGTINTIDNTSIYIDINGMTTTVSNTWVVGTIEDPSDPSTGTINLQANITANQIYGIDGPQLEIVPGYNVTVTCNDFYVGDRTGINIVPGGTLTDFVGTIYLAGNGYGIYNGSGGTITTITGTIAGQFGAYGSCITSYGDINNLPCTITLNSGSYASGLTIYGGTNSNITPTINNSGSGYPVICFGSFTFAGTINMIAGCSGYGIYIENATMTNMSGIINVDGGQGAIYIYTSGILQTITGQINNTTSYSLFELYGGSIYEIPTSFQFTNTGGKIIKVSGGIGATIGTITASGIEIDLLGNTSLTQGGPWYLNKLEDSQQSNASQALGYGLTCLSTIENVSLWINGTLDIVADINYSGSSEAIGFQPYSGGILTNYTGTLNNNGDGVGIRWSTTTYTNNTISQFNGVIKNNSIGHGMDIWDNASSYHFYIDNINNAVPNLEPSNIKQGIEILDTLGTMPSGGGGGGGGINGSGILGMI